uniref:CRAL-TRIO domain-containing protein n=1 Tax=Oryza brachyantha TaxID=4533 RepID=J3LCA6_ORYBR
MAAAWSFHSVARAPPPLRGFHGRKFLWDGCFCLQSLSIYTFGKKWRQDFHVSELSEESVKGLYQTGKAYVHDFFDIYGRPVLIVVASKHFPSKQDPVENEKLCAFLVEKALSRLPLGTENILGIFDLRGFQVENGDLQFLKFLIDVFYYYYPKRLGQVLFVDAPFVFQPMWQLVKPLLKQYASLYWVVALKRLLQIPVTGVPNH